MTRIIPGDGWGRKNKAGGWAKLVTGIDRSKKGGYAVLGGFLPLGAQSDVPDGSIVVLCWPDRDCMVCEATEKAEDNDNLSSVMPDGCRVLSCRTQLPTLLDVIEQALHTQDGIQTTNALRARQEAVETIHQLMAEHEITPEEL